MDQLLGLDRLGHVAERAGADHRHDVLGRVRHRQRQDRRRRLGRSADASSTATPPPSGRCTSSSTTSGDVARSRNRLGGIGGLAHDLAVRRSARLARRRETAGGRRRRPRAGVRRRSSSRLPGGRSAAPPRCPRPGVDSTVADPRPKPSGRRSRLGCRGVRRARRRVEARALVADEHARRLSRLISANTNTGAPAACRAALRSASRAAATSSSPRPSSGRSPIAVSSTLIPCSSSTSATVSRSAATSVSQTSSVSPAIHARSAYSWRRASRATAAGSWA